MAVSKLYCFETVDKDESSLPLLVLLDFFFLGFFRWVSSAQRLFSRFSRLVQRQHGFEKKKKEPEFSNQESLYRHNKDDIYREDVEMVMTRLGLFSEQEHEGLQEQYRSEEISSLFEDKEPSLEEVKEAFDVFDENKDGFIDATELQRVLITLGFTEGSNLENCRKMITTFDGNNDGRIDFLEFVKFMETRFC